MLRIDQQPIAQVRASLHPYLSAERPYFKDAKLEFWSFPRMYWLAHGPKDAFTLAVKGADGTLATHTVHAISVMDFEEKRGGELLTSDRSLRYFGQTAYLRPGPFSSADPAEGEAGYRRFIDSAFADIRMQQSQHLILDLRNNSGGHNAYSDYLIAYLADKPFRWYSRFQLKTSGLLKAHTRSHSPDTLTDAYSRAILDHKDGEVYAYELPLYPPVSAERRFNGPVYVLINRQTYSMAAVSAALLQDYGFATLAGEETADVPTVYASQFSFTLPKTGMVVKVPKGYMVRPNGDERLQGVVPELKRADHLLDEDDEILAFVLEHIRRQADR
ncbi:S41 family peptidase [Cesiribacter andamanensis]|uniref:Tail specific protease domain-containing protein n=1 Tax=Cesiribacter andamanensis AMV16 TaxID=1279009 RepID=M7NH80_9BACT|nr:S41 family peptidase [Cesiribacter andamanensis]EMR01170.1 hypothetical protein ADICEAN_03695 [Cesiribacter andamanensis AMV16]